MGRPVTAAVRLLPGVREPVRLAATESVDIATGGLIVVDGVQTVAGDRIALPEQQGGIDVGIYGASEGEWYRTSDANTSRAITKGVRFTVQEGDTYADTEWHFTTANPNIGEDAIGMEVIGSDVPAVASQAEAEARVNNVNIMTSLRTHQQRIDWHKDTGLIVDLLFGDVVHGSQAAAADNLGYIHAARDYIISNEGVGEVQIGRGRIYVDGPVTWRTGCTFAGKGRSQTFLTLADGSDSDLFQTIAFNTYAMQRTNHATKVAISRFGLRDIFLDGNKGNQSLGAQGDGNLISIYGHSYILERVNGMNAKAFGFWSEYAGSAPVTFTDWGFNYAPQLRTMCMSFCNAGGYVNRGPNDCQWNDVISQFNGEDGVTSPSGGTYLLKGRGIDVESGSYPTHGTIYDGGGQYDNIHSFSNFGTNFRSNTWIKGGLIETEGADGAGNVLLESGPVTTQTGIEELISYAPNVGNDTGIVGTDIQQPRVSIGILRVRLDQPATGSAPYNSLTGLSIGAEHFSCPSIEVDGLSVNRTTTAINIADGADYFDIAGIIHDVNKVDPTNQALNGSFGLKTGNVKHGIFDLSMDNVAVLWRRNSSSSQGLKGRITGKLISGQAGIVGNAGLETPYSADQIEVAYDDNGTQVTWHSNEGPIHKNAVTADTTFVVPAGMAIARIFIVNTTANAVTGGIRIGTVTTGTDVVVAQAVGANGVLHIADAAILKRLFSTTVAQTLFLEAVTNWNSASLNIRVTLKRLY